IRRILFICYANTCRTPAAEKLAEHYAKKYDLKGVSFDSAGWHIVFDNAQLETIEFITSKGIEMDDFRPKAITRSLVEKQDIIIGMERYQLTKIRNKFKDLKENLEGKLYTLKEFNGAGKKELNIPDPYKTGKKRYFEILEIVEKQVELLVQKVKNINQIK
ncbi:MAG: arsenate reductase/protein-tyrosine-phosphatase family protein, partial [Promethearchaeota archaeon]